jgi:hypothetical protein
MHHGRGLHGACASGHCVKRDLLQGQKRPERPPHALASCIGHVPLGACALRRVPRGPWPTQALNGRNDEKREREKDGGAFLIGLSKMYHFMIVILLLAGVLGWGILALYHTGVSASVRGAVRPAPSGRLLHAPQPVQGPGLRESLAPLRLPLCRLSRATHFFKKTRFPPPPPAFI